MAKLDGTYCGDARWYVVATRKGSEATAASLLTRVAGDALVEPAFVPAYETEAKYSGRWVLVTKPLVEGCVVAIARDAEALVEAVALLHVPCRVLGNGGVPVPLSAEQAMLFGGLGAAGRRVVPMSRGHKLANGDVVVDEGPLVGNERLIERIDRHKSTAYLRVDVVGEPVRARVGLAVLPEGAAAASAAAMPAGWAQARTLEGVA